MTVLLIGSKYDLTCDYVILQLLKIGKPYIRVNSEDLPDLKLALDPKRGVLEIYDGRKSITLSNDDIKSVLYRRPVFLRNYGYTYQTAVESFERQHWAVFLRNLMVFDECLWVNHPASIYLAEHKGVQIRFAKKIGFLIPETTFTNHHSFISPRIALNGTTVLKGIDTVLLRDGNQETFGFTQFVERESIEDAELKTAPAIFQQPIFNKTDIRVTVVENDVYSVAILSNGNPIEGDWRTHKGTAQYVPHTLPNSIAKKCVRLVKELNLVFGAIDLVLSEEKYYFLEINPTGEWAWLVDTAKLPIDTAFAKCLTRIN